MFLPPPKSPIKYLPNVVIYHCYPMDTTLDKKVSYKDKDGRVKDKTEKAREFAYLNCVMPYRQAEAYRKSKDFVDFGISDYVCDKDSVVMYIHNSYGIGDYGGRNLSNIILWHKDVYVGNNPKVARVVIGDESILVKAMEDILRYLSDVPFLDSHVADIVAYARSSNTGAISFKGSNEWVSPVWYIQRDNKLWQKTMTEYFRKW